MNSESVTRSAAWRHRAGRRARNPAGPMGRSHRHERVRTDCTATSHCQAAEGQRATRIPAPDSESSGPSRPAIGPAPGPVSGDQEGKLG